MDLVLRALLANQGKFISGAQIAEMVDLSRTAVWKRVQSLIENGYGIDCIKKKGYRLHTLPKDRLIPEKLSLLCSHPLEFFYKPEIDSTNLWAKEVMVRYSESSLFFTDKQYAGKGRLGRQWESAPGKDIAFSLGLRMNTDVCHYYQYTVLMALAVRNILASSLQNEVKIKWPNDIYINNKKICGILTEMITEENRLKTLIIGVGININSEPKLPQATSMKMVSGQEYDRHIILSEILNTFFKMREIMDTYGFSTLYEDWKKHLMGLFQSVRIDTGKYIVEGTLEDVNEQGIAVIRNGDHVEHVYSGDLFVS
ncbi:biotin--[acetyl-CoA-carboxylase] ligase [Thermospira aquatica]|uniref:Bifunctional ligase/repressor BirA n=1 Tax=Thermospira aquatica TaxID=2828656 RepID=A0AAX3BBQ4_9SPIR|nr:biotin--[acetyl-CoA-carboxylase] ligase [Thermospira aquatica]URA09748.1 biotin--[acetyl-CoA-carboxylase] ligase [Thermospira aquatica]